MAGFRPGTAPGSPALKKSSAPKIQRPSTAPEGNATASDWFECEFSELTCTTAGKLKEYVATPARKGMTNPPCNERIRKELLEYLTYCGIPCEPAATNRSVSRRRPKQEDSRPVSRSRGLEQSTSPSGIRSDMQSTSAQSMATSASAPEFRACTPELMERRQKRLMECRGDLGLLCSMPAQKLEASESRERLKHRRRRKTGVPQRTEWEMTDATWGLQLQARMHKFQTFDQQTPQDMGELGIYHNQAARRLWKSDLRCNTVPSVVTPAAGRKKEQQPPSQFRPDTSQEKLSRLRLQLSRIPRQMKNTIQEQFENVNERQRFFSENGDSKPGSPQARSQRESVGSMPVLGHAAKKRESHSRQSIDFGVGLKNILGEARKESLVVEAEALSPRTLMIRQECANLAAYYGLMVPFVEALREKFDKLDTSGDGTLSETEFVVMVQWLTKESGGIPPKQLQRMWAEFDQGGDGDVSFEEFLTFLLRKFPQFNRMTPTELNRFLSAHH